MPARAWKKKPEGLGDVVDMVTRVTGIKTVVNMAAKIIDQPCGCPERQEKLNELFPFKPKDNGISKMAGGDESGRSNAE